MKTVAIEMCVVVGLAVSLVGCGNHVWLAVTDESATRNADDTVELKATVLCETMGSAPDCAEAGNTCVTARWGALDGGADAGADGGVDGGATFAVFETVELCSRDVLKDGARADYRLKSTKAIPAGLQIRVDLKASVSHTHNEYERLNGPLASP
jgi:hypothetical protein